MFWYQSIYSNHQFLPIILKYQIQESLSVQSDLPILLILIHFGSSIYRFLQRLVCFYHEDCGVLLQGAFSEKSIEHSNLNARSNLISIAKFRHV